MDRSRLLPAAAIACGAVMFGWSLGGVYGVDRDLQAATGPASTPSTTLVSDRHRDCPGDGRRAPGRHEL